MLRAEGCDQAGYLTPQLLHSNALLRVQLTGLTTCQQQLPCRAEEASTPEPRSFNSRTGYFTVVLAAVIHLSPRALEGAAATTVGTSGCLLVAKRAFARLSTRVPPAGASGGSWVLASFASERPAGQLSVALAPRAATITPGSTRTVTVATLRDLAAAFADTTVSGAIIQADIRLEGRELVLSGIGRRLSLSAGARCGGSVAGAAGAAFAFPRTPSPPCRLDAESLSRHFLVSASAALFLDICI